MSGGNNRRETNTFTQSCFRFYKRNCRDDKFYTYTLITT